MPLELLEGWRLAVGTLTVFPVRPPRRVDRHTARTAVLVAPTAAVLLGGTMGVVGYVGWALGLPALVSGFLAVGVLALGTRCLHLDGLSDTVDGLAASYDRAHALEVMKSGTAGPAGVVALVIVIGVQATALSALMVTPAGAVLASLAVVVSRAALVICCARGVPSARPGGLGEVYAGSLPRTFATVVWLLAGLALAAVCEWAGLPLWRGVLAAALALAVVALLLRRVVTRIGGVTGDVFGAAIELALASLLVALA